MLRSLLKHFNILNILLIGILAVMARYTLYPVTEPKIKVTPPSQQNASSENETEKEWNPSSPADYMVIAEQNPFHPERKIPIEKKAEQPLPKPEFVLYGTLITDDLSIAYMEDKKSPVSTPGRGNRQTPLRIGQSLSGFTLKEIEPEKVVMVRGEETMTVYLNDPNAPKKREMATTSTPATSQPKKIETTVTRPPIQKTNPKSVEKEIKREIRRTNSRNIKDDIILPQQDENRLKMPQAPVSQPGTRDDLF